MQEINVIKAVLMKQANTIVAYHGSSVPIKRFDRSFSAQGVFWFCEDKNKILSGDSGAISVDYIMRVSLTVHKTAGWDEYEKYMLAQLWNDGYDSIKLDDNWVIFDSKNIKVLEAEQVKQDELKL